MAKIPGVNQEQRLAIGGGSWIPVLHPELRLSGREGVLYSKGVAVLVPSDCINAHRAVCETRSAAPSHTTHLMSAVIRSI